MQVVRGNVYKPRDTSFDLCGRGGGLDEKCGSIFFLLSIHVSPLRIHATRNLHQISSEKAIWLRIFITLESRQQKIKECII